MIGLFLAWSFGGFAPPELLADPTYQLASHMVGGTWEGLVGKSLKLRVQFHVSDIGMIVGDGVLALGGGKTLTIRSTLGWDAAAKQVYYLDQHGVDTVYFGHVTSKGDVMTFDFNGLVGDTGHYRSIEELDGDEYKVTMSQEENGKWSPALMHMEMHRVR